MSLDLTGIQNDNEFYSHHYSSAIFEGDLKDTFKQWQQQEDDYRETLKQTQAKPDTRTLDTLRTEDFINIETNLY